ACAKRPKRRCAAKNRDEIAALHVPPGKASCDTLRPASEKNDTPFASKAISLDVAVGFIRVGLPRSRRLPVYPGERTFSGRAGMSQKCQSEKNSM
ncbi:hypothetical protein, partial [Bradyrhizobium sp. JYMT SZCCT0180]|uniref:hypothetical protein n=1 Tax=Bradyrhizobium sp. JYMT SZCCT0180 TaxID=2807666 RepID=UPI001BA66117